ncbi:IucA/IucC family siderophore biosynthesis protein [Paenibacillus macerans]|uniref:IucA/IucC family protein n=1 Tax=Paenibacillus macerans TaxID=44252 RepID=UPI00203EEF3C|nr:IucA/IucC family protein [Paenibacillus macerans]MCM3698793.1 hypothetical protein [Paenibacillus macerans]
MLEIESKLRSASLKQANRHTCKLLLNCYIRELVQEREDDITLNADTLDYAVAFPASRVTVFGNLAYFSAAGEHEYDSIRWSGANGASAPVEYRDLVRWIIRELSSEGLGTGEGWPPGENLIMSEQARSFAEKVDNSCRNLALFIERTAELEVYDYRTSEQSLIYGHPFHPFPKNSLGFSEQDVRMYSPELRTSFQLGYFAVSKDVYREEWVAEDKKVPPHESVQAHVRHTLGDKSSEYFLLPAHPWQYRHVLGLPEVQDYVREGKIVPLGSLGPVVFPTTSVRTVYVPDMNCNIKLSLNMQITNLIRTNSDEQMRRTLDASRYLLQHGCFGPDSPTRIAYETGISTCRFADEELTRLFTVVYRPVEFDPASTYVLASLVEAPQPGRPLRLMSMLGSGQSGQADRWFARYLELSLLPLVRVAWEKGIHFEAHLQNTLLTLRDGMPEAFIIRDLEGVSVESGKAGEGPGISREQDLSGPLFYSREQAWARTSYYFIMNHLGSLIHAMARDAGVPEAHFWAIVRELLQQEYESSGNAFAKHLLTADTFYAKRNMLSCLSGRGEAPAYVPVGNLMKKTGE